MNSASLRRRRYSVVCGMTNPPRTLQVTGDHTLRVFPDVAPKVNASGLHRMDRSQADVGFESRATPPTGAIEKVLDCPCERAHTTDSHASHECRSAARSLGASDVGRVGAVDGLCASKGDSIAHQ